MDTPSPVSAATNIAQGSTPWNPVSPSSLQQYEPLLKAVRSGNLDVTEKFLKDHPEAVNARITSYGETTLQIAAMFRRLNIVEKLVQLMSENDIGLKDNYNATALHDAACHPDKNAIKAAKCMVAKNKGLPAIVNVNDWLPVTLALDHGHTEMARYLYSVTPFDVLLPENGWHGAVLLSQCYHSKMFDIALDLITRCSRLVVRKGLGGLNFLQTLATEPSAFPSEVQLTFWKRWLYTSSVRVDHARQEPAFAINEVAIPIPETTERRDDYVRNTSGGLLHQLVRNTLHLLGITKIYEARLAHKQSLELLRAACKVISTLHENEIKDSGVYSALVLAAKRGNPEFIVEAITVRLPLMWTMAEDYKRLFHLAVQFRQENVFNLIHGFVLKHVFANLRDEHGNSLLHMAGLLAPPTQLNHISGALLQMQRELQWFKEVESVTPPLKRERTNVDNKTARDLFRESHKDLVKQGEKWTKGTASSCSVVAALVATITFAAAFTVPGGNEQNNDQLKGYPIFLHEKLFMIFMIADAVSLFSSTTSLLMFLGLLTSRYAEEDFLSSLPTRLIIGLSTMFISLATMITAFCAALLLMLQSRLWIVIPVTVLACVPVTLYIWLQLPLLVEIFKSTYGPGIFDRNVKPWP